MRGILLGQCARMRGILLGRTGRMRGILLGRTGRMLGGKAWYCAWAERWGSRGKVRYYAWAKGCSWVGEVPWVKWRLRCGAPHSECERQAGRLPSFFLTFLTCAILLDRVLVLFGFNFWNLIKKKKCVTLCQCGFYDNHCFEKKEKRKVRELVLINCDRKWLDGTGQCAAEVLIRCRVNRIKSNWIKLNWIDINNWMAMSAMDIRIAAVLNLLLAVLCQCIIEERGKIWFN